MAKGKIGTGAIIALIAVVLFVAVPDFKAAVLGIFEPGTGGDGGNIWEGKCLEHDAITMTLGPSIYRYAPTTSIDTYGNTYDRLFINGIDKGLVDDGSTKTVSFGDKVVVYYAENSSEFYAAKSEFSVPCSAAFDTASMDSNDQHKLIAPKNLTVTSDPGSITCLYVSKILSVTSLGTLRYLAII